MNRKRLFMSACFFISIFSTAWTIQYDRWRCQFLQQVKILQAIRNHFSDNYKKALKYLWEKYFGQ